MEEAGGAAVYETLPTVSSLLSLVGTLRENWGAVAGGRWLALPPSKNYILEVQRRGLSLVIQLFQKLRLKKKKKKQAKSNIGNLETIDRYKTEKSPIIPPPEDTRMSLLS